MRKMSAYLMLSAALMVRVSCPGGPKRGSGSDANMAKELRNTILSSPPEASPSDRDPVAVVMDGHIDDDTASVMSSSAGDASIYLSTGAEKPRICNDVPRIRS